MSKMFFGTSTGGVYKILKIFIIFFILFIQAPARCKNRRPADKRIALLTKESERRKMESLRRKKNCSADKRIGAPLKSEERRFKNQSKVNSKILDSEPKRPIQARKAVIGIADEPHCWVLLPLPSPPPF